MYNSFQTMNRFLSCDWGNSSLRLRLADADTGEIYAEHKLDFGIAETWRLWLASKRPDAERIHFYTSILAESIGQLRVAAEADLTIVLSGMASSSIGLKELPYQTFPFLWDPKQLLVEKITVEGKFKHPLYLVSGFKTDDDIMRGEETLLLGSDIPDDDEKIFIFPGTHSKHVYIKGKKGIDFKTYMTGELFNLLSEQSILRTSVLRGEDEQSFAEGFKASMDGNLLHDLFTIRSRHLLHRVSPLSNFQWLSGLLIGTELRDLANTHCPVNLVCGEHLRVVYMLGLKLQNKNREIHCWPDDELLVKGHCKIVGYYL